MVRVRWFLAVGVFVLLTGCPSSTDSTVDQTKEAEIYEAVITDLSDQFRFVDPIPNRDLVLYVEAFDLEGIPLQVQVDMVAAFIDRYDVRFVDAREEAVDDALPRRPVRRGGALVGLDPIVEGTTTTVNIELYEDDEAVRAYRYTVTRRDDGVWAVVGEPETILPDGFVG